VKAGEPLDINVPMVGSPTPTVEWQKDGIAVRQTHALTVESDDDHTRMLIPVSKRSDSGPYTIVAKNNLGEARADIKVHSSVPKYLYKSAYEFYYFR